MTAMNIPLLPQRTMTAQSIRNESNPAPLAALRNQAHDFRLRRRQPLPATGTDTVFSVIAGVVAVESTALATKRTMVELLYPGDIFAPSFHPHASGLHCTAIAASELRGYTLASITAEMGRTPGMAEFMFRQLNRQRTCMQLHITMLAGLSSDERVAALLLQAGSRLGSSHGGAISFDMPLSRVEVAEYLALNADTLSRIMSRLVRDGVLERANRARITIRDWDALKALCPLSDAVIALHSRD
jgi:CRP/FNR family transcriptional regulator